MFQNFFSYSLFSIHVRKVTQEVFIVRLWFTFVSKVVRLRRLPFFIFPFSLSSPSSSLYLNISSPSSSLYLFLSYKIEVFAYDWNLNVRQSDQAKIFKCMKLELEITYIFEMNDKQ